jgi:hypothetical protein
MDIQVEVHPPQFVHQDALDAPLECHIRTSTLDSGETLAKTTVLGREFVAKDSSSAQAVMLVEAAVRQARERGEIIPSSYTI